MLILCFLVLALSAFSASTVYASDNFAANGAGHLSAQLDKSEVKRGESVNVSGEASGTEVVDIVVMGARGLRKMPDSITSEIALADGFRFMTVEVAENKTFKAEIRIPEEVYLGFHHVMVLAPGEDGVYGATTRTGGELFDAMLDYIASKGGCEDVLPGKSTEQLVDIIAAATFNATDSDDLAVDLTFMGGATVGKVTKLNPIASVVVGEPLVVTGTTELEDGSVVIVSTISGPIDLDPYVVKVENESFCCTFDTSYGKVGTYVMQAEDMKGNIDTETFELLASVPSSAQILKKAIEKKSEDIHIEASLTVAFELEEILLVVSGITGHSINIIVPENATFPGGINDNPPTNTIGPAVINDTIDADGKRKYGVFFNNTGVYTITAVDTVVNSTDSVAIEVWKNSVCFDMPCTAVIGETVSVRGTATASGNLDIVIDDILMFDDLLIYDNI